MKISTRIFSVVLALILVVTAIPFSGSAKTLEEIQAEIDKYEQEIADSNKGQANAKKKLEQLQEQSRVIDQKITLLEKEMAPIQKNISELTAEINEFEKRIKTLEKEIEDVTKQMEEQEQEIKDTQELLRKRMRATYMAGETSELEIFLSASDFSDFLASLSRRTSIQSKKLESLSKALATTSSFSVFKFFASSVLSRYLSYHSLYS